MMGVSLLKLGRVDVATRTLAKARARRGVGRSNPPPPGGTMQNANAAFAAADAPRRGSIATLITQALELARERGAAMQDDIWRMLARAKYTAYLQSPAPGLAARRRELLGRLGPLLEAEAARREAAGEPYAAAAAAAAGATQRQGSGAEASTSGGAAAAAAAASDSGVTAAAGAGAAEGAPSAEPMDAESGDAAAQQGDSAGGDQLQLVPSASCAAPPPQQPPQEPPTLASDLSLLASAFAAADALDARRDPPAEFCCPLTLEVFRDPVLGPCGHSYERSALLEHLAKVGHFDPITRKPLKEAQLVKNVGLRVAAHAWLDAHPWVRGCTEPGGLLQAP